MMFSMPIIAATGPAPTIGQDTGKTDVLDISQARNLAAANYPRQLMSTVFVT